MPISTLERLESDAGLKPRTTADCARVREKVRLAPETLTAIDFAMLEYFGSIEEAKAAEAARHQALYPTAALAEAAAAPNALTILAEAIIDLQRFVDDMNTRNKERNAKIADLEQRLARLEAVPPTENVVIHQVREGGSDAKAMKRIDALKARVEQLEARSTLRYTGVWSADEQYNVGDMATHDGSLWCCLKSTRSRPGTDATFQLVCKRGRDGKDLR